MAKWYEAGFMMTQPKTSNYAETKVTGQLEVLIATVQQLLQKKEKEAYLVKIIEVTIASGVKNLDTL